MEQFEVGEWYDFRNEETGQVAAKFIKTDGEYFYFLEYIRQECGYNTYKGGNWQIPKEVKKFPLEELYKYLPELKPKDYEIY